MIMNNAKNGRWIIPFKKFCRLRVKKRTNSEWEKWIFTEVCFQNLSGDTWLEHNVYPPPPHPPHNLMEPLEYIGDAFCFLFFSFCFFLAFCFEMRDGFLTLPPSDFFIGRNLYCFFFPPLYMYFVFFVVLHRKRKMSRFKVNMFIKKGL